MGRAKIEIKKIEDSSNRHVTFCKRKMGLFKKARELSVLCDARVGLLVLSNSGRIYECSAPNDMEHILEAYNSARGLPTRKYMNNASSSSVTTSHQVDVENTTPVQSTICPSDDGLRNNNMDLQLNCMRNDLQVLSKELRLLNGNPEELKLLSFDELQQLEKKIEHQLKTIRQYRLKDMEGYNNSLMELSSTDGSSLEYLDTSDCSADVELRLSTRSTSNSDSPGSCT